jgi:tRNA U34 5-carboxymethylaminomethyl modifying GTPase MnmE/TrmE
LASADLVLLVFDASSPWSGQDKELASRWPAALQVFNKCDLIAPETRPRCHRTGLSTSAIVGDGIAELQREIAHRLVARAPDIGQAVPFLAVQAELLASIRDALAAGQLAVAAALLALREKWGGEAR